MRSAAGTGLCAAAVRSAKPGVRNPRIEPRGGFGLLELIIVIAIIAIVTVVAVLQIPGLQEDRDRIAADQLRNQLRYAQSLAVSRELATRVVFDVTSDSYSLFVADTNAPGGYAPLKDPATQNDWVVNIADRFPGVGLGAVNINGNNVAHFSETNGVPCDMSGIPLAVNGTITFDSGRAVTIAPDTGYVW